MSLKENVDYIKEELSSEEKFLESSFKAEKFYKKYKYIIFTVAGLALAFFIISSITQYQNDKTKKEANIAYENIMENPEDTASLEQLKTLNTTLYEIAMYKIKDSKENLDVEFLKDIQTYQKAVSSDDLVALNTLIASQNFLLKDFASVNKALIHIKKQEYTKAKTAIKAIGDNSSVKQIVTMIEHFLITK